MLLLWEQPGVVLKALLLKVVQLLQLIPTWNQESEVKTSAWVGLRLDSINSYLIRGINNIDFKLDRNIIGIEPYLKYWCMFYQGPHSIDPLSYKVFMASILHLALSLSLPYVNVDTFNSYLTDFQKPRSFSLVTFWDYNRKTGLR